MRKILLKILLATFPIFIVLGIYFYNDPFKVLYHYDSYLQKDGIQYVVLNRDYISTETFLNNYPKYKYDSYIFGNSRSGYYSVAEWEKHIQSTRCYHFDASGEGLYGIERKINLLHERHVPIKNALIVFDQEAISVVNNKPDDDVILRKDPLLTGGSKLDFELANLQSFFDINFLKAYFSFLVTHKPDVSILNNIPTHYEVTTNELTYPAYEALIARNADSFYQSRAHVFYQRSNVLQYAPQTIEKEELALLANIKRIFEENHTNYRIVISPLYNQVKIDPRDVQALDSLFGRQYVYDFSGINDITENSHNYYENSHYRPLVAKQIMDSIYSAQSPTP
jgi:hypothetical protein